MKKFIILAILLFAAPVLAGQTFNPHTGQWEQDNQPPKQPDIPAPHGGHTIAAQEQFISHMAAALWIQAMARSGIGMAIC